MPDNLTLASKIKEYQRNNELATAQRDRQRAQQRAQQAQQAEANRKKAEDEYNNFLAQKAKYEAELKELELQQAEYQKQIDAIKAKDEAEKQALIDFKLEQERRIERKKEELFAIREPARLERERLKQEEREAIEAVPTTEEYFIWKTDPKTGKKYKEWGHFRPMNRNQRHHLQNQIRKKYSSKYKLLDNQTRTKTQSVELKYYDVPQWIKNKVRKEWNPVSYTTTSMVALAKRYYEGWEARKEYELQSSIKNAQSNAIIEQAKFDMLVHKSNQERDKYGKQLNEGEALILSSADRQTAIKHRPHIKHSQYFKDNFSEESVIPKGIIGSTYDKSLEAYRTYKETQKQTKELHTKITNARNAQEALEIKSRYQEANPYSITANVFKLKGGIVSSSGVLIEKKLDKKFESDTISSEQAHPKAPITSYEATANPDKQLREIKTDMAVIEKKQAEIPTYIFLDEQGNAKEVTNQELFGYSSFLINLKPQMPSKSDMILSQYMKENASKIESMKGYEEPSAYPITADFPFEQGVIDHVTELRAGITNIGKPEDQREQYNPTLEGLAYDDLISSGEALFFGEPLPKNSKSLDFITEKSKTSEGIQYMAGSVFGSAIVLGASILFPPLAVAKYQKYVTNPRVLRKAEKIADELKKKPTQEEENFPSTLAHMQAILKEKKKQHAVGVEMLNDNTALITRGTETAQVKTPYIVVKKDRSYLYETYDKKPGIYQEIIVSGKQGKELERGVELAKDIKSYPAKNNMEKIMNTETGTISKTVKPVGTKKSVSTKDLIKYPVSTETKDGRKIQSVIESVESQPVKTGSIILETERLSKQGVKQTDDYFSKTGDKYKGDLGSKELDYHLAQSTKLGKTKDVTKTKTSKQTLGDMPKSKPGTKDIKTELPPTSKGADPILKPNPAQQRKKELEKIIKETEKTPEPKADFVTLPASSSIITSVDAIRTKGIQTSTERIKQTQKAVGKTQTQVKQEIQSKSDIIQQEKEIVKQHLKTTQDQKPVLDPRYSLIVEPGQDQKGGILPKVTLELSQTPIADTPSPIVPDVLPSLTGTPTKSNLVLPGDRKERQPSGKRGGKWTKGYFAWNVDTERVGVYLPTADLVVGKTSKVITQMNQLQKRTHTRKYASQVARKTNRAFDMRLRKSNIRLKEPKMYIPFISKPRFKNRREKKRFDKKFGIHFGF